MKTTIKADKLQSIKETWALLDTLNESCHTEALKKARVIAKAKALFDSTGNDACREAIVEDVKVQFDTANFDPNSFRRYYETFFRLVDLVASIPKKERGLLAGRVGKTLVDVHNMAQISKIIPEARQAILDKAEDWYIMELEAGLEKKKVS